MRERAARGLDGSALPARTAPAHREGKSAGAARRDQRLAQIRKLSMWITGSAAAASLGLGTAFAHALPGHNAGTAPRHAAQAHSAAASGPAAGAGTTGGTGTSGSGGGSTGRDSHKGHKLAAPAQRPAPAHSSAPPAVNSGGS
jgi:hypothetical protein